MDKNFSSKAVRDGAMMSALTVIFLLIAFYVPVFSVIGMFLSGLPLAVLYIKHGLKPTIWAAVVSSVVFFAFCGQILSAVSMIISNAIPGIAAGVCIKKRYNLFTSVIYTGTAFLVGIMVEILMIRFFMGGLDAVLEQIFENTRKTAEGLGAMMTESGGTGLDKNSINSAIEMVKTTFRMYFPSMLVIISCLAGYILYSVYVFIIRRLRLTSIIVRPFSMLRTPRGMVNTAFILYVVSIFISEDSYVRAAILNVATVLYSFIIISGFSCIDYKLSKKIKKGALRGLIYVLVMVVLGVLMPFIMNICLIIGLLDSSMNFRRISPFTEDEY